MEHVAFSLTGMTPQGYLSHKLTITASFQPLKPRAIEKSLGPEIGKTSHGSLFIGDFSFAIGQQHGT